MRRIYDWKAIQRYYDEGYGFRACQRRFGCTHYAWAQAEERGDLCVKASPFRDRRRRYDWAAVQAFYDDGHSLRECKLRFGFCNAGWAKAQLRGEIKARKLGMSIDRLLDGSKRSRCHIKVRLLNTGLIRNECETCGLVEWRGRPLAMHLDHINGIKDDHRLKNLRMLCPNCHSQTDTYGGRNRVRRRLLQENKADP